MTKTEKESDPMQEFSFVEEFTSEDKGDYLQTLEKTAADIYKRTPFPDAKTDGWRKIKLEGFLPQQYKLSGTAINWVDKPMFPTDSVLQNAIRVERRLTKDGMQLYSEIIPEMGAQFTYIDGTENRLPLKVVERFGTVVQPQKGKFAAFSHAFSTHRSVLYIQKDQKIEQPIEILDSYDGDTIVYPTSTLIYLERNASATILRNQSSINSSAYFHSGALEIYLEEGASLELIDIKDENAKAWNIQNEDASLESNANLNWFLLTKGGKFSKQDLSVYLQGRASQARVTGLFLPKDEQQIYYDTFQKHLAPQTESDLLFHGVIDDKSRSIWQGMVFIDEEAGQSNGYQANHNLVLNKAAKVDSIPGLEILTDDVRCSHGVTIKNIDDEQLFYLKSRGIDQEQGEELIVTGFIQQAVARIRSENIKEMISEKFISKINKDML